MNKLLLKRFAELAQQLNDVEATKRTSEGAFGTGTFVDNDVLINWSVKAKNLLVSACGKDSQHFILFEKNEETTMGMTNWDVLKRVKAVFLAAKEDFEGGYLTSVRALVQAELFDSELDQAAELLRSGYKTAAAVIAGVVLETTLRDMCGRNGIEHASLNKMNADLAKAGIYNLLQQKRITALADIRNSAAHGQPDKFSDDDVSSMIRDVLAFVSTHIGN